MKILHTTDLHFNKGWFEWVALQQKSFDLFCITGDFLEPSSSESLSEQIAWVSQWMKAFKKPLFICSGNHDIEVAENQEWFNHITSIYSDNTIQTIEGITFGCIPYTDPEFDAFGECDVVLYHLPPAYTKTSYHEKKHEERGDRTFYKKIKEKVLTPSIVLCGHVHKPTDTRDMLDDILIYNPGVNKKSPIPNHFCIDIDSSLSIP